MLELPQGYEIILNNVKYIIGKPVGRGGSSIVYSAKCENEQEPVLIKELCPKDIQGITRNASDMSLVIPPTYQALMNEYEERAEFEYDILTELRINRRNDENDTIDTWFKKYYRPVRADNGVLYTVVVADAGDMLDDMITGTNKLKNFKNFVDVCECVLRLLAALKPMHEKGYLHLDIAPDNIHFLDMEIDGHRVANMIDFNSAYKMKTTEKKNRRFSIKDGYSANELKTISGTADTKAQDLRPATDLYSVSVIFFELLTGRLPKTIDRTRFSNNKFVVENKSDYLISAEDEFVRQVNDFLKKGISSQVLSRFQSVEEMHKALNHLKNKMLKKPVETAIDSILNGARQELYRSLDSASSLSFLNNLDEAYSQQENEIEKAVTIHDGIYYGNPLDVGLLKRRNVRYELHMSIQSMIDFGSVDKFPDKLGDIIRHNKIDEIKECISDRSYEIVVLHGANGIGKSRLVRQFLLKHRDAYQNFCYFRLNEIVDYDDFSNSELFSRILDNIPLRFNVRTQFANEYPIDVERKFRLNAIQQLNNDTLLIVENAKNISQSFVENVQRHKLKCKIVLSTNEPCDFLDDYPFCKRVSIAFDRETEFNAMNSVFYSALKNQYKKEMLSESVRKEIYEELDYNTQIIVLVANMLNISDNAEKIIDSIVSGKISTIDEKLRDKKVIKYKSLFEYVSELVPNLDISTADELSALYAMSLLGKRKLKYSALKLYYNVQKHTILSLHDKGVITFDVLNDNISISSILIQVYYEKVRLLTDSTKFDLFNNVAKGLIKEYTLRNCLTFAETQKSIESFAYGISRLHTGNANSPIDSIISLIKSGASLADDIKINLITNMAELYNALGKKDESYQILKSIDFMEIDKLSKNRVLYLNVLKNKYHLGRLLFSVDDIDESISQLEEISCQLESFADDDNWQFKGIVYFTLITLYEIKGDDDKYIETAEKAIVYYNSKEQYYGSLIVLGMLMRGSAIPKRKGQKLLKLIKKSVYSMTSNNSIELISILALGMLKKMFEFNLHGDGISYENFMDYILRHGSIIAYIKMFFPLKRTKSKLDPNDASGKFYRYVYHNVELTPEETTESIWDFFKGVAERFENLHLHFGMASEFQRGINFISRNLGELIEVDKILANDLIIERMKYELENYRTQLLLTNMDVARIKGELYKYFATSLGISEALRHLNEYEADVNSIPHNYIINRAESLENLGDLYDTIADKELDDESRNKIGNLSTGLSIFKGGLRSKANHCYREASLIVPKSNINTWARIKYKAGKYQEVYDELKSKKIYSCIFCNCCYQLAQVEIDNNDEGGYNKYLKNIIITSMKVMYCRRTECFFKKVNKLRQLHQQIEREDAKQPLFLVIVNYIIAKREAKNRMLSAIHNVDLNTVKNNQKKVKKKLKKSLNTLKLTDKQKYAEVYSNTGDYFQHYDIVNEKLIAMFLKYLKKRDSVKYMFLSHYFDESDITVGKIKRLLNESFHEGIHVKFNEHLNSFHLKELFVFSILKMRSNLLSYSVSNLLKTISIDALQNVLFGTTKIGVFDYVSTVSMHYNLYCKLRRNIENMLKVRKVCDAEDLLFNAIGSNTNLSYLPIIDFFYITLAAYDDKTLDECNFHRSEIEIGRRDALNVFFTGMGKSYYTGNGVTKSYYKAVEWFQKALENEYADAQNSMGDCYYFGNGVGQDYFKAAELYEIAALKGHIAAKTSIAHCYYMGVGVDKDIVKAAEYGHNTAQNELGMRYYKGEEVEQDYIISNEWFYKSALQGNAAAQYNLGYSYYYGEGLEQDYEIALEWFEEAALNNHIKAHNKLCVCYYEGIGTEINYAKAVEHSMKAAEEGYVEAMDTLGLCYLRGHGVDQDYSKSVEWFRNAAEKGYALSQLSMGNRCYEGQGIEQDYVAAVEWFTKAAESGNSQAQGELGLCYLSGLGVDENYERALELIQKAAENNTSSQIDLASCYYYGIGVEQNYRKAVELYSKPAEKGRIIAQSMLGLCYYYGNGVDIDYKKAVEWFMKVKDQGSYMTQLWLGDCYYNGDGVEQDYAKAVECYENAKKEDAYNTPLKSSVWDRLHGNDRIVFDNGDIYEGEFEYGHRTGKGKNIYSNGDVYEGDFLNGLFDGVGVFISENYGYKYEGGYVNGQRSGFGKYIWSNGDHYEGEWLKDRRHGKGKMTYAENNYTQIGQWQNDKYIETEPH